MKPTRPLLRYHGGKWRLAEFILAQLPPHDVYVEPFGGAASVLLQKDPARIEIYNDLEQEVVNLFRVLRVPARADELRRSLELTLFSRAEYEEAFDGVDPADVVERARRLVLRMGQSIGNKNRQQRSGWRTRTAKSKISPTLAWSGWPEHMPAIINRLRYTILECLPWQQIVALYDDPHTLFYCDPPYCADVRSRNHKKMYVHEMSLADHEDFLKTMRAVRGMVALSAYPHPLYESMLTGWTQLRTRARAQTNAPRVEVLWLNPRAAAHARQQEFQEVAL